jgi:SAM-dependent methyltransferase
VIAIDSHSSGSDLISCWIGLEPLPLESSSFDVVTAFDFLEHLPRAIWRDGVVVNTFIDTMSEVWRILKPQGLFVARTPAYPHP